MASIKRALISVSDKTAIITLAKALEQAGVEILSTGGTAKFLSENGLNVTEIATYTNFPEMMGGRVKTLHPKIHAGLLARTDIDDAVMAEHAIKPIDLLIVNLYPFAATIANPQCDLIMATEQIDIGGPAMLRSAAKNYARVAALVDPNDYTAVLTELTSNNWQLTAATRLKLAAKVFAHTANYDSLIANYLQQQLESKPDFPPNLLLQFKHQQTMRYGENPHQQAALYSAEYHACSITNARQLQGKELSYNNIADADAAFECIKLFDNEIEPACVIVKHANPCGVAIADNLLTAYNKAYQTDPTSAFGGIIAFNQTVDADLINNIIERQFVEVIIAPEFTTTAITALSKKANIRALACGSWWEDTISQDFDYKSITGGLLVQQRDSKMINSAQLQVVSQKQPTNSEIADLIFAWKVAKFVKSNAIVYAKNGMTIGVGAGQMSRVYSAKIAAIKAQDANLAVNGAVMASDAFFPFRDGIDSAAAVGIQAVIQPGGSMRDAEVIAAANEHNMAMVFTGIRHFRH